ncbi:MAG: fumarate hydratase [Deltaproteobacteria bacterium]|nr:fumarate hydratase [Deltaproteobacteria bacterium]
MKTVKASDITARVRDLCISAATDLEPDVVSALDGALKKEESPLGKEVLEQIIENFNIARREKVPMCQDTGVSVFFVEMGKDVMVDGSLEDAINEGVRKGYTEGFLRKSVCDPLSRKNSGDNTPAVIHVRAVPGDKLKIKYAPKGAGSENMSALRMLKPAEGIEGIKAFVIDTIKNGGGNPCPPIVVGVGIGGNFEKAALLAKEALLRPLGNSNKKADIAVLEAELLQKINGLGIGPMGFGGTVTALAVHVETYPCHIASLPVAINIQCHADRHKETVL